jgi:hypothetical protein
VPRDIAEEIAELQAMTVVDLLARYREVFGKEPRVKNATWLWRKIAWKIQEVRFGGLSEVARRRLDELIAEIDLPLKRGESSSRRASGNRLPGAGKAPAVGTTLVRTWRGRDILVRVVEDGYEYEGTVYRSLSAVSEAVTGSHWNGRLFFGLNSRRNRA